MTDQHTTNFVVSWSPTVVCRPLGRHLTSVSCHSPSPSPINDKVSSYIVTLEKMSLEEDTMIVVLKRDRKGERGEAAKEPGLLPETQL